MVGSWLQVPEQGHRSTRHLPDALRTQLADALVLGDTAQLDAALRQVRDVSPGLADALDAYIQEFNYAPVLDALETPDRPVG